MADLSAGATAHLDARGLLCPLPVIRTQDAVARLAPGTTLEILATDPGALHDIRAWCRVNGHSYLDDAEGGSPGEPHFHIRLRVSD
jgi:tRNA 2-thiouridine synthesizing protein A